MFSIKNKTFESFCKLYGGRGDLLEERADTFPVNDEAWTFPPNRLRKSCHCFACDEDDVVDGDDDDDDDDNVDDDDDDINEELFPLTGSPSPVLR